MSMRGLTAFIFVSSFDEQGKEKNKICSPPNRAYGALNNNITTTQCQVHAVILFLHFFLLLLVCCIPHKHYLFIYSSAPL